MIVVKQSFTFRADQLDKLDEIRKTTGIPKAVLVRQALDHFLSMKETKQNATSKSAS